MVLLDQNRSSTYQGQICRQNNERILIARADQIEVNVVSGVNLLEHVSGDNKRVGNLKRLSVDLLCPHNISRDVVYRTNCKLVLKRERSYAGSRIEVLILRQQPSVPCRLRLFSAAVVKSVIGHDFVSYPQPQTRLRC